MASTRQANLLLTFMRILKKEIMDSEQEVMAYDLVVSRYLDIVHAAFAETVINLSPSKGKFLDLGTGTGWDSILIAKNTVNVQICAVDLSDVMLKMATNNSRKEGVGEKINFIKADAKSLPFEDGSFDAVFSQNMLHHQPEPEMMLAEIRRVVKPAGAVIIRDLVRHSKLVNTFCVNSLACNYDQVMKKEYEKSILAAFSRKEWLDLIKKMGLSGSRMTTQFMTHASIERPSAKRRTDYVKVVNPFYKRVLASFYISKL